MYRARGIHGIGFVLTTGDPCVGLDLDHCLQEGQVTPQAQQILDLVPSYTEVSPSSTGLRILVTAPDFIQNRRREHFEIYSRERFLTLTGNHLAGTPDDIRPCTADQLGTLIAKEVNRPTAQPTPPAEAPLYNAGDVDLWEHIFTHDRFGEHHRRRFLGDTSLDGGDHSLTVIRLLNTLVRWTGGDPQRMRALMLLTPLANDKWFTKRGSGDWLDHQIADAIQYTSHDV